MSRLPILLIEDGPSENGNLADLLERFDYHSVRVSSAEAALARLHEEQFAAVFVDLETDDLNSLDCIRKIHAGTRGFRLAVPVIAVTEEEGSGNELMSQPDCIVAFLTKPPDAEELRHLLLQFVYDPAAPNLTTLTPVAEMSDWFERRNGTN